jgi:hypothetical protein
MFRVKINPQTVISVENSLPRIVVSLLMITFSFAIAGFLVDLMYFVMVLIISQLSTVNVGDFTQANKVALINRYAGAGFWDIYPNVGAGFSFYGLGKSFLGILPDFVQVPIRGAFSLLGALLIVKLIGAETWKSLFSNFTGIGAGGGGQFLTFGAEAHLNLGGLSMFPAFIISLLFLITFFPYIGAFLMSIVMLFTLIFLLFRVFFMLLKTYINIVLLIIFAPLILLLGAIPGRNMFWIWFKNLSINLLIFPFVLTLILIGRIIVKVNTVSGSVWQPPFISGLDPDALSALIGIGLILIIPQLVKLFKEAVGLKGVGVQFGVGTFFGGVTGVTGGVSAGLSRYGSLSLGINALRQGPFGESLGKIPGVGRFFKGGSGERS